MTEDKVLEKVRKLLAQAASTNFEGEANSFLEKAQELMLKYAIDEAQLGDPEAATKPVARMIQCSTAYGPAQVQLAWSIAGPLGVKAVKIPTYRGSGKGHQVEFFGFEKDVDFAELLYTSLLQQAYIDLEREYRPGYGRTWKNNFLFDFAYTVGKRLQANRKTAQANIDQAAGHSMALVLVPREKQIDAAWKERHPNLSTSSYKRTYDLGGAAAGRAAGNRADISGGKNRVRGPRGELT